MNEPEWKRFVSLRACAPPLVGDDSASGEERPHQSQQSDAGDGQIGEPQPNRTVSQPTHPPCASALFTPYAYCQRRLFTVVLLHCHGHYYPCHRVVLASSSAFFFRALAASTTATPSGAATESPRLPGNQSLSPPVSGSFGSNHPGLILDCSGSIPAAVAAHAETALRLLYEGWVPGVTAPLASLDELVVLFYFAPAWELHGVLADAIQAGLSLGWRCETVDLPPAAPSDAAEAAGVHCEGEGQHHEMIEVPDPESCLCALAAVYRVSRDPTYASVADIADAALQEVMLMAPLPPPVPPSHDPSGCGPAPNLTTRPLTTHGSSAPPAPVPLQDDPAAVVAEWVAVVEQHLLGLISAADDDAVALFVEEACRIRRGTAPPAALPEGTHNSGHPPADGHATDAAIGNCDGAATARAAPDNAQRPPVFSQQAASAATSTLPPPGLAPPVEASRQLFALSSSQQQQHARQRGKGRSRSIAPRDGTSSSQQSQQAQLLAPSQDHLPQRQQQSQSANVRGGIVVSSQHAHGGGGGSGGGGGVRAVSGPLNDRSVVPCREEEDLFPNNNPELLAATFASSPDCFHSPLGAAIFAAPLSVVLRALGQMSQIVADAAATTAGSPAECDKIAQWGRRVRHVAAGVVVAVLGPATRLVYSRRLASAVTQRAVPGVSPSKTVLASAAVAAATNLLMLHSIDTVDLMMCLETIATSDDIPARAALPLFEIALVVASSVKSSCGDRHGAPTSSAAATYERSIRTVSRGASASASAVSSLQAAGASGGVAPASAVSNNDKAADTAGAVAGVSATVGRLLRLCMAHAAANGVEGTGPASSLTSSARGDATAPMFANSWVAHLVDLFRATPTATAVAGLPPPPPPRLDTLVGLPAAAINTSPTRGAAAAMQPPARRPHFAFIIEEPSPGSPFYGPPPRPADADAPTASRRRSRSPSSCGVNAPGPPMPVPAPIADVRPANTGDDLCTPPVLVGPSGTSGDGAAAALAAAAPYLTPDGPSSRAAATAARSEIEGVDGLDTSGARPPIQRMATAEPRPESDPTLFDEEATDTTPGLMAALDAAADLPRPRDSSAASATHTPAVNATAATAATTTGSSSTSGRSIMVALESVPGPGPAVALRGGPGLGPEQTSDERDVCDATASSPSEVVVSPTSEAASSPRRVASTLLGRGRSLLLPVVGGDDAATSDSNRTSAADHGDRGAATLGGATTHGPGGGAGGSNCGAEIANGTVEAPPQSSSSTSTTGTGPVAAAPPPRTTLVALDSQIRSLSRSLDAAVGEIALLSRAQRDADVAARRRLQLATGAVAQVGAALHDAMGAVHCLRGEVEEGVLAALFLQRQQVAAAASAAAASVATGAQCQEADGRAPEAPCVEFSP